VGRLVGVDVALGSGDGVDVALGSGAGVAVELDAAGAHALIATASTTSSAAMEIVVGTRRQWAENKGCVDMADYSPFCLLAVSPIKAAAAHSSAWLSRGRRCPPALNGAAFSAGTRWCGGYQQETGVIAELRLVDAVMQA